MLLDVQFYAKILQEGQIKGPPGSPIAQRTNAKEKCFMAIKELVDVKDEIYYKILKIMWELETDVKRKFTKEEQLCELMYKKTYKKQ